MSNVAMSRERIVLAAGYVLILLGFIMGLVPRLDGQKILALVLMTIGLGMAVRVLAERTSREN